MAVDPHFRPLLDDPTTEFRVPPANVTPAMLREAALARRPASAGPAVHATRDIAVRGADGPITARLYFPSAAPDLPLIVFIHGGCFILCDLDTHDELCRSLANASGFGVASIEYRLAPETRFPGPLEDCYAALVDLESRAAELGFDRSRLAVCGDSAGGNLAAAVALLARDRHGPRLRHQVLLYPVIEAACDSPSMREFASGYLLSREFMRWGWDCYLSSREDEHHPLAVPLYAASLEGLPPMTLITAECDPLRDEGEKYAERVAAAGVPVIGRRYLGMIHGFMSLPRLSPVAARALADAAQDLRAALT
jgi:acetyl esterase